MGPQPGVPDDLADFCRDEWPRLVKVLSVRTGSREAGEDLAQETLVRVCAAWPRVRTLHSPVGWTYHVAQNLVRSRGRRQAVRRRTPLPPPRDAGGPDASWLAAADLLRGLPPRQQAVLRFVADLPVHDVAIAMGCAEGTVKSLTARALQQLRAEGAGAETPSRPGRRLQAPPATDDERGGLRAQ